MWVVVMVGHRPPAKVIFKLCLPEVACWRAISSLAGGSLRWGSGRTRVYHHLSSASFSKSKSTLVMSAGLGSAAGNDAAIINPRRRADDQRHMVCPPMTILLSRKRRREINYNRQPEAPPVP